MDALRQSLKSEPASRTKKAPAKKALKNAKPNECTTSPGAGSQRKAAVRKFLGNESDDPYLNPGSVVLEFRYAESELVAFDRPKQA
jgi:hypothetical protein